ncbi:hypothetical protein [Bdellovibrio reynosensis]|uniref:Phytase n=1 Tax=Bdellovibrio reynosensis TaxID=2835041 RepID=A0ABY4C565_9BACT|nr:hypothetical protein [Bdellovibrio reynosensis]UOF00003.1 hypothetical protein MNR06_09850 [Bdellovibrio reynosensis]
MALLSLKLFAAGLFLSQFSQAGTLPDYSQPELLARAHYKSTYQLPPSSFLNNTSPVINNKGEVAFKVMAVNGTTDQALWLKTQHDSAGKIIYVAASDKFVTDPGINDLGQVTYSPFNDGFSDGLFVFDSRTAKSEMKVSGPDNKISYFGFAQTFTDGTAVFRGLTSEGDRGFYEMTSSLSNFAMEGKTSFGVAASYLFSPAMNEAKQWAFKVRHGGNGEWGDDRPDRIYLLTPVANGHDVQIIAEDNKANAASPFSGFGNSLGLAKNGLVVFVGHDHQGKKSLIVYESGQLTTVVSEGKGGISELELFAPKINSYGVIAFRAKNEKGLRGIYIASKQGVKRLIGEGDSIPSDLGDANIISDRNFPGFAGNLDLNESNELVFACVLIDSAGKKIWGDAVYKLAPKKP